MSTTASSSAPSRSSTPSRLDPGAFGSGLQDRARMARRLIVASGMRVGRLGALVAAGGAALAIAAKTTDLPAGDVLLGVGLVATVLGLFPFFIGWQQSKMGTPFLRALTNANEARAIFMDAKGHAGGRRAIAVLLQDGSRQVIALPAAQAAEVADVISALSPNAERGERVDAARLVSKMSAASAATA